MKKTTKVPFDQAVVDQWHDRVANEGYENLTPDEQKKADAIFQQWVSIIHYDEKAKHAPYWCIHGDSLFRAARLIKVEILDEEQPITPETIVKGVGVDRRIFHEMRATYFFLAGLAIENYVKGIITMNSIGNQKKGKLDPSQSGHNLPELVKTAKVAVTASEKETLAILADYVVWIGRYPIPKEYDKSNYSKRGIVRPVDEINFISIVRKLLTELSKHKQLNNCLNILK